MNFFIIFLLIGLCISVYSIIQLEMRIPEAIMFTFFIEAIFSILFGVFILFSSLFMPNAEYEKVYTEKLVKTDNRYIDKHIVDKKKIVDVYYKNKNTIKTISIDTDDADIIYKVGSPKIIKYKAPEDLKAPYFPLYFNSDDIKYEIYLPE